MTCPVCSSTIDVFFSPITVPVHRYTLGRPPYHSSIIHEPYHELLAQCSNPSCKTQPSKIEGNWSQGARQNFINRFSKNPKPKPVTPPPASSNVPAAAPPPPRPPA